MGSIGPSTGCWAYSSSFSGSCLSFKEAGATLENGKEGVLFLAQRNPGSKMLGQGGARDFQPRERLQCNSVRCSTRFSQVDPLG